MHDGKQTVRLSRTVFYGQPDMAADASDGSTMCVGIPGHVTRMGQELPDGMGAAGRRREGEAL